MNQEQTRTWGGGTKSRMQKSLIQEQKVIQETAHRYRQPNPRGAGSNGGPKTRPAKHRKQTKEENRGNQLREKNKLARTTAAALKQPEIEEKSLKSEEVKLTTTPGKTRLSK